MDKGREVNGDGQRLGVANTVQCTDDVLWNCAPDTCVILLACVAAIKSNKKEKKETRVEDIK